MKHTRKRVSLVVATKNPGKMREFYRLFSLVAPDIEWVLVDAVEAGLGNIDETGSSFQENARIKALAGANRTSALCLGEDSGLEVDALGGAPGIYAHRFSPSGKDEDNNELMLQRLKDVPFHLRTARYYSAICVAAPDRVIAEGTGTVEGAITGKLLGNHGFGYDPLFYCFDLKKTFGQATDEEKDKVSHRRRALEVLLQNMRLGGEVCF